MKKQAPPTRPLRHARDFAQAIIDAYGDVERQRQIFTACPVDLRSLAREMAKSGLAKAEQRAKQLVEHREMHRRAAAVDPAPLIPTRRISSLRPSSPEVGRARLAELRAALGNKESA